MESKVTCRRTITVSETEYKLLYHLRMLANRAKQRGGVEMALVRITAAEVGVCGEVRWAGDKNGG